MYNIIRPKTHDEWLQYRQGGIGSSEVATIVGLNPYETPYQLWRRKKGMDEPKEQTFAMKAGHFLEDAVSLFFQDETGNRVVKSSAGDWLVVNNDKPFMRVSPDRTFWIGKSRSRYNKGILECKTTQMSIDGNDLPKHWFCQLQYQLGVAEMEHGALAWLSSGREFGYKMLDLVPDFYRWLSEEVEKFWVKNVIEGNEPEAVCAADVAMKFATHTEGKVAEATEEMYFEYLRLKEIKSQLKTLETQEKDIEDKVKMMMDDCESIAYHGQTLATWKSAKPSSKFDTKGFCKANPAMAENYMIQVAGSRRFLLK